jgi:hypothetical protein
MIVGRSVWYIVLIAVALGSAAAGQSSIIAVPREHPAILYSSAEPTDPVAALNRALVSGQARLSFDGPRGYLTSVLTALDVPVESQTLVFSETSFQPESISPKSPRALYFNDRISVGWVKGAATLEIASQDPRQGVIFYTLDQKPTPKPQFQRDGRCLQCHETPFTGGVPGLLVMSMLPLSDDPREYAQGWSVDHRTPIEQRWGGWYVTGERVPTVHLGNVPVHHVQRSYVRAAVAPQLSSVVGVFDSASYLSPHSDVAALLVLNHQVEMTNQLTKLGWQVRAADHEDLPIQPRIAESVREFVDYLFFVHEAPLPATVRGVSGFAEKFSGRGPFDRKGRSLRQLELSGRLLRYPCSYVIYSPAFDSLAPRAREAVYRRMWEILSGQEDNRVYARLSKADRQAIVEILRDTKPGLPDYFNAMTR